MDAFQAWVEGLSGLQLFSVITGAASLIATAATFGINMLIRNADHPRVSWSITSAITGWTVHEKKDPRAAAYAPEEEPHLHIKLTNVGTSRARNVEAFTAGAMFVSSEHTPTMEIGDSFWLRGVCYPKSWANAHFVIAWDESRLLRSTPKKRFCWINFEEVGEAPFPENELRELTAPATQQELLGRSNPNWPLQSRMLPEAKRRKDRREAERTIQKRTSRLH